MSRERIRRTIALFANDRVGLEICRFLRRSGDTISMLCVHDDPARQKFTKEIIRVSRMSPRSVVGASKVHTPRVIARLKRLQPDFIITVYWAYLLEPEVFTLARLGTINFHPALLPINRGWYPHVHSILDGSPSGVTLHALEETADTGPIWIQKQVPLLLTDTADTIYLRLQEEIVNLFQDNWERIKRLKIQPRPQDERQASYHKKKEVDQFDFIDLNKRVVARDLINQLRA